MAERVHTSLLRLPRYIYVYISFNLLHLLFFFFFFLLLRQCRASSHLLLRSASSSFVRDSTPFLFQKVSPTSPSFSACFSHAAGPGGRIYPGIFAKYSVIRYGNVCNFLLQGKNNETLSALRARELAFKDRRKEGLVSLFVRR